MSCRLINILGDTMDKHVMLLRYVVFYISFGIPKMIHFESRRERDEFMAIASVAPIGIMDIELLMDTNGNIKSEEIHWRFNNETSI